MKRFKDKFQKLKKTSKSLIIISIIQMVVGFVSIITIWCLPIENLYRHLTISFGILCFFWAGVLLHLKGIEYLQLAKQLEAEYKNIEEGKDNGN